MIRLQQEQTNYIVYTATEFETTHIGADYDYTLYLTNCQDFKIYALPIYDVSQYKTRFNESSITLMTLTASNWDLDTYTITASEVKIVKGDVNISTSLTNEGTLIVFGSINGTFSNTGTYSTATYSQAYYFNQKSYLFNMPYGFYDYTIYDNNNTSLEIGNVLIGPLSQTQSTTTYTPVDTKIVYNP